jgi:hypothetical protein
MGEDMVAGAYKDINYDKELPWFEFNDGKYFEKRISLLDMLLELSTLCTKVGNDDEYTDSDRDALMVLYKNGAAEALVSFNRTLIIYKDELATTLAEKQALVLALLISILCVISMFF